jgi:hypothetical protein
MDTNAKRGLGTDERPCGVKDTAVKKPKDIS